MSNYRKELRATAAEAAAILARDIAVNEKAFEIVKVWK